MSGSSVCGCERARDETHASPCRRVRQPRREPRRHMSEGRLPVVGAAELHDEGLLSGHRDREARERAFTAADAAKAAEAGVARALDRAAEAHERAARAHEHAAEVAELRGDGSAPRHRRAAEEAHEAARCDRAAAVDARDRSHRAPFGEHR